MEDLRTYTNTKHTHIYIIYKYLRENRDSDIQIRICARVWRIRSDFLFHRHEPATTYRDFNQI